MRVASRRHKAAYLPQKEWTRHQFVAVIDGVSGASRLACGLLSGSVVFKQTSPFYSWFERWLEPFVHYLPVEYDLSNLLQRIELARARPAQMRRIAAEATSMTRKVFSLEAMLCYISRLLAAYRGILAFTPGPPAQEEGWQSLSELAHASREKAKAAGDTRESEAYGTKRPEGPAECIRLLTAGDTRKALRCYAKNHKRSRAPHNETTTAEGAGALHTTWLKLVHDTEMLEHIGGRLPAELQRAPQLFRGILQAAVAYKERPTKAFSIQLPEGDNRKLWQAVNNRNVYAPPAAKKHLDTVLNPKLNLGALEDAYFASAKKLGDGAACGSSAEGEGTGGWVVVDDAFSADALKAVREYLTESSFYYFPKFGGHYLSALLEDGMAAPLIEQLAEELRKGFPRILGKYPLRTAWAFKFDNTLNSTANESFAAPGNQLGVGVHADSAAVNLNFWPMEKHSADEGGLSLYLAGAPEEMPFEKFNDPKYLKSISDAAAKEEIEYRANRLVIFNSNLLHETGRLHFSPGYLRRRINLTLLFGQRCKR
eukprot:gnl/TRDRNA2_/TRDRNA2_163014_c0_seq1.p1 gnl/TRDRNA2_/TRDRNA2_163014_c0~~gnl/TRDRNA2_/TRDRNA2_163014_c0_seq1.p1  ORF type:complete len:540 (+),score=99.14 gnl/TRDRNA2_/TRDRNA2_163014_c0_seq1:185-1804(+)